MKSLLIVSLVLVFVGCVSVGCPDDEDHKYTLWVEDISVYDRYVDITVLGDNYNVEKRLDDGVTGSWVLEPGDYIVQGLSADGFGLGPNTFTISDHDVHFLIDDLPSPPNGVALFEVP